VSSTVQAAQQHPGSDKRHDASLRRTSIGGRVVPYTLLGVLAVEYLIFVAIKPDVFLTSSAFTTILSSQAPLLIATLGLTITLIVKEFDLSIGANLVFVDVMVAALAVNHDVPLALAVVLAVAAGIVVGAINALLVVCIGIDSFIATLGMSTLLTGVSLWVAGSTIISDVPAGLTIAAASQLFGVPAVVYYAFGLAIILWFGLTHLPIGRYLYFVGANEEVARLAGLRSKRLKAGAFIASAGIVAIAGVMQAGTVGSADPTAGGTFMLPAFAAAFLGATAVRVGKFNVWGTMIASYLLFTGITGLALLGHTGWVQDVFNGLALLVAVIAARFARRK
jgi:ribose transport system permease protein